MFAVVFGGCERCEWCGFMCVAAGAERRGRGVKKQRRERVGWNGGPLYIRSRVRLCSQLKDRTKTNDVICARTSDNGLPWHFCTGTLSLSMALDDNHQNRLFQHQGSFLGYSETGPHMEALHLCVQLEMCESHSGAYRVLALQ